MFSTEAVIKFLGCVPLLQRLPSSSLRKIAQSKSIWSSEQTHETCSLVERILQLEPVDIDIFKGTTLPDAPHHGKVFGGQFIGHALAAATKTVDSLKIVHSLHAYFLLVGDLEIIYHVHRIRDGSSFATRRIDAIQKGSLVFTMFASFQKEEVGFSHQIPSMPAVPNPELLLSTEDLRESRLTNPCLSKGVAAYTSDHILLNVSLNPHRRKGLKTSPVSLNHSMWFYRPLRADEWLLFVITSPTAYNAHGFVSGKMFNRKGELVASM